MNKNERLSWLIKGTSFLLDDGEQQILRQFGLTVTRYYLLHHVQAHPGILPSELSEKLLCHRSNVTRLVRSLEKEELIERQHDKSDYRTIRLVLTTKGKALFLRAHTAYEKYVYNRLRRFNSDEKQLLINNLKPLFDALRHDSLS